MGRHRSNEFPTQANRLFAAASLFAAAVPAMGETTDGSIASVPGTYWLGLFGLVLLESIRKLAQPRPK